MGLFFPLTFHCQPACLPIGVFSVELRFMFSQGRVGLRGPGVRCISRSLGHFRPVDRAVCPCKVTLFLMSQRFGIERQVATQLGAWRVTIPGGRSDVERGVQQHRRPWVQDFTPEELVNGWGSGRATDGPGLQDQQCWEGHLPVPGKAGRSPETEQARAGGGRTQLRREQKSQCRTHMPVGTGLGRGEAVPA